MKQVLARAGAAVVFAALLSVSAVAQQQQPAAPAPPKPYKPVVITLPQPMKDPAFESFRKQVAEAATKKDLAAIGALVTGKGFFWDKESGVGLDKKKTGAENLATALGLNNKDGAGWDMLAAFAEDPTTSASGGHKGAFCAPADPGFDHKAFDVLLESTQTDIPEWAFPLADKIDMRPTPLASAPVAEKLGLHFIRILPDSSPAAAVAAYVRVVSPSGKTGYVPADMLAPLGNDQLCYVKDGAAWKIGGYIGAGDEQ